MQINNDQTSFQGIKTRNIKGAQNQILNKVDNAFDPYVNKLVEKLEDLETDIFVTGTKDGTRVELKQNGVADSFIPRDNEGNPISIEISDIKEADNKVSAFINKVQDFIANPSNKFNDEEFAKSGIRANEKAVNIEQKNKTKL